MSSNKSESLLGQSKQEYARYLKNQDIDVFAEAGELLWESFKAYLKQASKTQKLDSAKALGNFASQKGETINDLFFHCQHFHAWYTGEGVPNDFVAEKKLYTETLQSFEKLLLP